MVVWILEEIDREGVGVLSAAGRYFEFADTIFYQLDKAKK